MINELLDFYFNYCPVFSERFEKHGAKFLFSRFVKDHYSNIAIVNENSNLTEILNEFKSRDLEPSFYSFSKPNKETEILYTDDFLYYENITKLYNKFKRFKSSEVSLIEVTTPSLEQTYIKINDDCYGAVSYDNPYSNLDNAGYSKSVFDFKKHETNSKTIPYIIRLKNKDVGCIILSIHKNMCYVSGLAILKEFRKTKVFTVMINILEILISENVNTIFCVTELGEYPEKLYKKIVFTPAATAYGFKPNF